MVADVPRLRHQVARPAFCFRLLVRCHATPGCSSGTPIHLWHAQMTFEAGVPRLRYQLTHLSNDPFWSDELACHAHGSSGTPIVSDGLGMPLMNVILCWYRNDNKSNREYSLTNT
ncbi:hypothetical protein AHAS_Ahas10G0148400 [Arachis hypogaea]